MKLAAWQAPLLPHGSMAAIALARERIAWCEAEGIRTLLCPEALLGGLADDAEHPTESAISVENGELETLLTPLASDTVTTIIGFTEITSGGKLHNSAAILHRGALLGVYRKRHPAIRRSVYSPGEEMPVFTVDGLTFGIMICNDTNYPELARTLVARGAQALFVPSNNALSPEKADVVNATHAVDIACARENRVPVIRADVAGRSADRVAFGTSIIVGAGGDMLALASPLAEDMLVTTIPSEIELADYCRR
ncbi:MAG: carbon-nitrogen hydrolase family protein [Sphingomonas sp.]